MADSGIPSCVVSVIIPAYNAEKFIGQAIQSVLNQGMEGCEILVVNDGSKDGTAAELETFKERGQVRVLTHPGGVNRGVCISRRLALQEARGEFVAFLDADDEYLPGKLERHIRIMRENAKVVLVHSASRQPHDLTGKTNWAFDLGTKTLLYDITKTRSFLMRNFICNSTIVCRRSAIRPEEDLPSYMANGFEDWVLTSSVAFRGLFYYDPEPLSLYDLQTTSLTSVMMDRPGAFELASIEFYLLMLPRVPRLHLRFRVCLALVYKLIVLMNIRRPRAKQPGRLDRMVHGLIDSVIKRKNS